MKPLGIILIIPLIICAVYLALLLWPITLALLGIWLIANA